MNLKKLLAATALVAALPAQAALTMDAGALVNANVNGFDAFDAYSTTGPEAIGGGVTFTGDDGSVLGAYIADLGTNGLWGLGNVFAATGAIGELRFTFDSLTSGAGALVNHYELSDLFPFAVVVSAYGDNNQIIETYTVSVDTDEYGFNEGTFLGIIREHADIRSIAFKGNAVVVDDLSFTTPVPEPETYAMLLAGLGMIGAVARRRRDIRR
jgi:hypothetical protein